MAKVQSILDEEVHSRHLKGVDTPSVFVSVEGHVETGYILMFSGVEEGPGYQEYATTLHKPNKNASE